MSVSLVPMPAERFPAWLEKSVAEYAADLMALGRSRADAERAAARGMAESFPGGETQPGHFVFDIADGHGRVVGYLWIGASVGGAEGEWWLWDIFINEVDRGRGLGSEAMVAAEDFARGQGVVSVGLSVFGFNSTAQHLYEKLGYRVTSIKMAKELAGRDDGGSRAVAPG